MSQEYSTKDILIDNYGDSQTFQNKLVVDYDGFLWYSCPTGLVKSLANHKTLIPHKKNISEWYSNYASAMLLDSNSKVWVVTEHTIFIYNLSEGIFKEIDWPLPPNQEQFMYTSIIEDDNQNIWIGTSGNYVLKIDSFYNIKTFEVSQSKIVQNKKYLKSTYLYMDKVIDHDKILMHRGKKIFITSKDSIYLKADFSQIKDERKTNHLFQELQENDNTGDILITNNGALLSKDKSGYYLFMGKQFRYHYIKDLDIQIVETPFNEMKYTENTNVPGNLYSIDDSGKNIIFFRMKVVDGITCLEEMLKIEFEYTIEDFILDSSGIMYVSCLDKIKKIKFLKNPFHKLFYNYNKFDDIHNVSTRGFVELANGNILLASYSGIFELTPEKNSYSFTKVFPEIKDARELEKINDSIVYAIGDYNGIYKINTYRKSIKKIPLHVNATYMYNLAVESDSTFLISAHTGLMRFNYKKETIERIKELSNQYNLGTQQINDVHIFNDNLYISTRENGLYIKNQKTGSVKYYNKENEQDLLSNSIFTVFVDSDNTLWIGTDKGVNYIKKGNDKILKLDLSPNISGIITIGFLEDLQKNIWISTYKGIYLYDKNKGKTYPYYINDGLPSDEFNQQSYFKSNKGRLFFGGINGIVYFDSLPLNRIRFEPSKIFPIEYEYLNAKTNKIISVDVFNQKINKFNLPYSNNFLSIKVALNTMFDHERDQYLYKIEGLSEEWINIGNQGTITLYYLPPGNYTLRIKGINAKGIETSNELMYKLNVDNIFYNELWFKALSIFILVLLSTLIIIYYVNKHKQKAFLELALIELKRKSLITKMNPHFIFNAINNIKNQLENTQNATFVENYIVNLSKLMRLTLELTRNENVSINKELDYIHTYMELENSKKEDPIKFITSCDPKIDKERSLIPSMMIQPIIENSIKHAFKKDHPGEKIISLRVVKLEKERELIFIIEDNGIGISSNSLQDNEYVSYGIQILRERMNLLNKTKRYKKSKYQLVMDDLSIYNKRGTRTLIKIPF